MGSEILLFRSLWTRTCLVPLTTFGFPTMVKEFSLSLVNLDPYSHFYYEPVPNPRLSPEFQSEFGPIQFEN